MGIIALITAALQAAIEYFKWQSSLAQINARRLVYDIANDESAKIEAIRRRVNSATDSDSLAAARVLIDAQADAALYLQQLRSAVHNVASASPGPDIQGGLHPAGIGDLRSGGGVSTPAKPST